MKILVISDLHRSKKAAMQSANVAEVEEVDQILVLGDISHNDFKEATSLLELIANSQDVCFVPGNMDSKELLNWTNDKIRNIHCKVEHCEGGLEIMGIGGSTITPFNTMIEFNEDEMISMLNNTSSNLKNEDFILVSHCPPKNTKVDKTNFGMHGGSKSIFSFIKERKPTLNLCGHIHEAFGTDKIGESLILNPGSAKDGRYAIIEDDSEWRISFNEF